MYLVSGADSRSTYIAVDIRLLRSWLMNQTDVFQHGGPSSYWDVSC